MEAHDHRQGQLCQRLCLHRSYYCIQAGYRVSKETRTIHGVFKRFAPFIIKEAQIPFFLFLNRMLSMIQMIHKAILLTEDVNFLSQGQPLDDAPLDDP